MQKSRILECTTSRRFAHSLSARRQRVEKQLPGAKHDLGHGKMNDRERMSNNLENANDIVNSLREHSCRIANLQRKLRDSRPIPSIDNVVSELGGLTNESKEIVARLVLSSVLKMPTDAVALHCIERLQAIVSLLNRCDDSIYNAADTFRQNQKSSAWLCDFFETFTQLSLVEGWTLNAEYSYSILEGHVVFFAQDVNGERVGNVLEVVAPMNDSPFAALDAVLLDHAMSQAGLYWHACYESREFIANIMDFSEYRFCGEVAGDVLMTIGNLNKFWNFDFTPSAKKTDDGFYNVRYVTFSPFCGFVENHVKVPSSGVIGELQKKSDVIFPYDCGISF